MSIGPIVGVVHSPLAHVGLTANKLVYKPMFHEWPTRVFWRLGLSVTALAWMSFIFYLSSLSQDQASDLAFQFGDIKDNAAHFALFGILAALLQASIWSWRLGFHWYWALAAVGIAAFYGALDEYHQTFVAGRSATLGDVFFDVLGAAFSVAVLWTLAKLWRSGAPISSA